MTPALLLAAMMGVAPTERHPDTLYNNGEIVAVVGCAKWDEAPPISAHINYKRDESVTFAKLIYPDSLWINPDLTAKDCYDKHGSDGGFCMAFVAISDIMRRLRALESDTIGYWLSRREDRSRCFDTTRTICPPVEVVDTIWVMRKR